MVLRRIIGWLKKPIKKMREHAATRAHMRLNTDGGRGMTTNEFDQALRSVKHMPKPSKKD